MEVNTLLKCKTEGTSVIKECRNLLKGQKGFEKSYLSPPVKVGTSKYFCRQSGTTDVLKPFVSPCPRRLTAPGL